MKLPAILSVFILLSFFAQAEVENISFQKVSDNDGLTNGAIKKIVQDGNGAIWLATGSGIIRYDSKNFKHFIHSPSDTTSLFHNSVTDLAVDKQEILWIGTRIGLCYFDHSQQSFVRFLVKLSNSNHTLGNINSLSFDKNGNLWIVYRNGFGILNKTSHQLFELKTEDGEIPDRTYTDRQGNIWLSTMNGSLYSLNHELLTITRLIKGNGSMIETCLPEKNQIWIGTKEAGVQLYSNKGELQQTYFFNDGGMGIVTGEPVRKIIRDKSERLWIGTFGGIYMEKNGNFQYFNPKTHSGLSHPSVYEIFEDKKGGLWFGTWAGGLSYCHDEGNHFRNFSSKPGLVLLNSHSVSSFVEDAIGNIYIGYESGGIDYFNKTTSQFSKVNFAEINSPKSVKTQCFDKFGGHWIGTNEQGLWYKKAGSTKFKHYSAGIEDGNHLSNSNIYSICPVDSGVWIGTHGGGVNFYSFKTNKLSFYKPKLSNRKDPLKLYIRSIYADSKSNLWLGTIEGIYQVSLKSATGKLHNSTADSKVRIDYINSIAELDDGNLWIGTRASAISIYDNNTNTFQYFDAEGLIKGKDVYSIINDENGNLWFTSSIGLVYYNTKTKEKRLFTSQDGIQGRWFLPMSVFRDTQNDLYFGGTNGFTIVSPNKIKFNARPPEVIITKLIINNQTEKHPFFKNCSNQDNQIQFSYKENTIKIEFVSDNYLLPEKNKFRYRLVNYYDHWIDADQDASAFFVNLPWGKYQFEVQSCNNDGIWSTTPTCFMLTISKPFYASNLAILAYILIFIIIITAIIRNIKLRAALRNQVFEEKLQREQKEMLNELKLKFFTNISHEFRTPLSLISGPVKQLKKSENLTESQAQLIDTIWRNTSRLLTLVNQVIDLRKIDKRKEELNPVKLDLVSFVQERALNFRNEADELGIKFIQDYPENKIEIDIDGNMIDKIIFNLLSNAFKHTPKHGVIRIGVLRGEIPANSELANQLSYGELNDKDYISIYVSDNGAGIDQEDLLKIFNRFEQGKSKIRESSGIGLSLCHEYTLMHHGQIIAQSSVGKGSRFIVRLPLKQSATNSLTDIKDQYIQQESNDTLTDSSLSFPEQIKQRTVLVVDDNHDFRNYLKLTLSHYYKVLLADNGKAGLEILENEVVDCIISDVMMPVMNGYEFCSAVKSNLITSHIPVILLTALSSSSSEMIGIRNEADAYITKPFNDELLIAKIGNLLLQRQKLRELFSPKAYTGTSVELEGLDNYFLKKLNSIIEQNIKNESFDIDLLVQEMGISRSQLHRKLKNITNFSTTEYIRIYRLEKAVQIMQKKEHNIDEISFLVGFTTHAYFTRSFKNHFGESPSDYMKRWNKTC